MRSMLSTLLLVLLASGAVAADAKPQTPLASGSSSTSIEASKKNGGKAVNDTKVDKDNGIPQTAEACMALYRELEAELTPIRVNPDPNDNNPPPEWRLGTPECAKREARVQAIIGRQTALVKAAEMYDRKPQPPAGR
jgi:hypothetical protein